VKSPRSRSITSLRAGSTTALAYAGCGSVIVTATSCSCTASVLSFEKSTVAPPPNLPGE
jgi:hypothetical protein